MADKYRITTPELVVVADLQTRTESFRSIDTVLWEGVNPPDSEIIDILLQGQVERRHNQITNSHVGALSYGHHMFVEKRKHVLLGWSVIRMISIPSA